MESVLEAQGLWGAHGKLTKSGIEHIESHPVAFLRSCDRHQTLVAVILGLVDLNDTARDLADFVDLLTTLTDDGANHIVRDKDLLRQRRARNCTTRKRLSVGTGVRLGYMRTGMLLRLHVRASAITSSSRTTIVHGNSGIRLRRMRVAILRCIGLVGWHVVRAWVRAATAVIVSTAIVSTSGLGNVRDNLHATRSCWATAAGGVGGCRWATKALVQLLEKGATDIVCCDVNGVSHASDNEGTLR